MLFTRGAQFTLFYARISWTTISLLKLVIQGINISLNHGRHVKIALSVRPHFIHVLKIKDCKLCHTLNDFEITRHKCPPHRDDVSHLYLIGQGHTTILKFTSSQLEFIGTHFCVCYASKDFKITWHRCLTHQDDVS
jgi:hypothetical protein